jgi:hypothetical protein
MTTEQSSRYSDAHLEVMMRFESDLGLGKPPRLRDYLARFRGDRRAMVAEMVAIYRDWHTDSGIDDRSWVASLIDVNPDEQLAIREALEELSRLPASGDASRGSRTPLACPRIGDYVPFERLGGGGFADAYVAGAGGAARLTAIKVLREDRVGDRQAVLSLAHERLALRQLPHHPGLVQYVDWEPNGMRPAVVTEFIDGAPLKKARPLVSASEAEVVGCVSKLCEALHAAHQVGVFHGDVTPSNVILRYTDRSPVLIDFGLAEVRNRYSHEPPPVARLGGTREYAAPEVFGTGDERPDPRLIDVFGVGAVLYFLLTGEGPLARSEGPSAGSANSNEHALSRAPYSPELKAVCREALSVDPADRYETLEAFRSALHATSTGRRMGRSLRRRQLAPRLAVVGAIVALVAAVVGAQAVSQRLVSQRVELPESLQPDGWVKDLADERGVTLNQVTSSDFSVRIGCVERVHRISSVERPGPNVGACLVIEAKPHLHPFIDSLSFRVGRTRWQTFPYRGDRGELFAYLTPTDIESGGSVQVRLGSTKGPSPLVGPFTYPVASKASVTLDEQLVRREIIDEATRAEWLVDGLGGWQLSDEFTDRFGGVVAEYRVWPEAASAATPIALSPRPNGTPDNLQDRFGTICEPLQQTHSLWTELRFRDGTASPAKLVRRRNSYGHDGSDSSALKILSEVPSELPMANLRVGNFNLAGLALADLALESVEVGPTADDPQIVYPIHRYLARPNLGPKSPAELAKVARQKTLIYNSERFLRGSSRLSCFDGECYGSTVPPIWKSVYVRGRLRGGAKTPIYRIDNEFPLPGYEVPCLSVSPGGPKIRLFLYGYAPTKGIAGYTRPQNEWKPEAWLYSVHPNGTMVEYCEDSRFRDRLYVVKPGVVYARVFTNDETLGGCEFRIDEGPLNETLRAASKLTSATEEPSPPARPAVVRAGERVILPTAHGGRS